MRLVPGKRQDRIFFMRTCFWRGIEHGRGYLLYARGVGMPEVVKFYNNLTTEL